MVSKSGLPRAGWPDGLDEQVGKNGQRCVDELTVSWPPRAARPLIFFMYCTSESAYCSKEPMDPAFVIISVNKAIPFPGERFGRRELSRKRSTAA